jgi:hypothetical protein
MATFLQSCVQANESAAQANEPAAPNPLTVRPDPCFQGSLWEAALSEPGISVWRDSLRYTGLSQLLDARNPGVALFIPEDSGLFRAECNVQAGQDCYFRQADWRISLTTERGIGLLMMHWAFVSPANLYNLGPGSSLNFPSLLQSATNQEWLLHVERVLSSSKSREDHLAFSLGGTRGVSQDRATPDNSTSKILRAVRTCGNNGTLYVIDRPTVPAQIDRPQASVNSLLALNNYCWKNFLSVVAGSPSDLFIYLLIRLAPPIFEHYMDPGANTTWFLPACFQSQFLVRSEYSVFYSLQQVICMSISTSYGHLLLL